MTDDSKAQDDHETQRKNKNFEIGDKKKKESMDIKENTSILESITKLIIVPIYGCVFLGTLALATTELEGLWSVFENFLVIICITIVGSGIGVYGVYKWGTISMEIDRLNGENNQYEGEINLLKNDLSHLKKNVSEIQSTVSDLNQDTKELNESLKEFDGLIKSLKSLSGENEVLICFVFVLSLWCFFCLLCCCLLKLDINIQ